MNDFKPAMNDFKDGPGNFNNSPGTFQQPSTFQQPNNFQHRPSEAPNYWVDGATEESRLLYGRPYPERYEIQYTPERASHYRPKSKAGQVTLYVLAVFLPPVSVFLKAGCGGQVILNTILWILCWIPGVLHAFYIIATYP